MIRLANRPEKNPDDIQEDLLGETANNMVVFYADMIWKDMCTLDDVPSSLVYPVKQLIERRSVNEQK